MFIYSPKLLILHVWIFQRLYPSLEVDIKHYLDDKGDLKVAHERLEDQTEMLRPDVEGSFRFHVAAAAAASLKMNYSENTNMTILVEARCNIAVS